MTAERDGPDALSYRGRFAPSPTGELHLGSAATAIICDAAARAAGGALVLRVEDLDRARVVPGAACRMLDALRWLGIRWTEGPDRGGPFGPYVQSERLALYESAVERLAERGHCYFCDCSRAEIARVASAPHAGDDGPVYPGTCRGHGMRTRAFRRPPAVRLRIPDEAATVVDDLVLGRVVEDVAAAAGDFVLRRGDGVFAYQLAVVVDDLAMAITDVVRGADLAASSARQALLARLLGGRAPRFAHVPMVVGGDGGRLAKRAKGASIAEHRAAGRDPADLVRAVARAVGADVGRACDPIDTLAERLELGRLRGVVIRADDLRI